jgi:hypothetical protein
MSSTLEQPPSTMDSEMVQQLPQIKKPKKEQYVRAR